MNNWNPTLYQNAHSFVWKYGASLLELLAPQPGERILDLGCGTGQLTAGIAAAGAEVVGLDSADAMIAQARQNYPALRFEQADGTDFAFAEPFDAVFSNAAIHWMRPPERVVACVWRALKAGGRLVAEFGGKNNVQEYHDAISQALQATGLPRPVEAMPLYFPSLGEYATLLEQQGFTVTQATYFERPTPLEGGEQGLANWLHMFGGSALNGLPDEQRGAIVHAVEGQLRPTLFQAGGWIAPYRRLRIATKK